MEQKKIKVTATGADTVHYKKLVPFQGNLKDLRLIDYERLRNQILELGFSEPITVWICDEDEAYYILNGHQRLRALTRMIEEEGFEEIDVPISFADARNKEEAKRMVLSLASQYGTVTEKGLFEFLQETGIPLEDLSEKFRLPEIDVPKFIDNFFPNDIDAGDIGGVAPVQATSEGPGRSHSSGVKMVQLFFNDQTFALFMRHIEELSTKYNVNNVTDAVARAVAKAHAEDCT